MSEWIKAPRAYQCWLAAQEDQRILPEVAAA